MKTFKGVVNAFQSAPMFLLLLLLTPLICGNTIRSSFLECVPIKIVIKLSWKSINPSSTKASRERLCAVARLGHENYKARNNIPRRVRVRYRWKLLPLPLQCQWWWSCVAVTYYKGRQGSIVALHIAIHLGINVFRRSSNNGDLLTMFTRTDMFLIELQQ